MENFNKEAHWENIYLNKKFEEVSWYQKTPQVSLDLFENYKIDKNASIIDVGGGDSYLVDFLLELGYRDLTVLDILKTALEKAKKRLGKKANLVKWIVADISAVKLENKYSVWHDRAAFHFLRKEDEINNYLNNMKACLKEEAFIFMASFSTEGPLKCSGIEIQQYSQESMKLALGNDYNQLKCFQNIHQTPFGSSQNFLFCIFKKIN